MVDGRSGGQRGEELVVETAPVAGGLLAQLVDGRPVVGEGPGIKSQDLSSRLVLEFVEIRLCADPSFSASPGPGRVRLRSARSTAQSR